MSNTILAITIFLLSIVPNKGLLNHDINTIENKSNFNLTLTNDGVFMTFSGVSDFSTTPSSYSIYMNDEAGKCAIHLLNFKTPPVEGTYDVQNKDLLTTGLVCITEINGIRKRLVSESGTFVITDIIDQGSIIKGYFDMVVVRVNSGSKYHITGKVESSVIHSDLKFR